MAIKEYEPGTAFPGVMGRTVGESSPAWPRPLRAKPGSPNVLFIVLDDTGFGQLGCFGSPIRTPNLDRLAANGLRFNNMHTTALCSPSRSCMLTGRNHHSNAMACITEGATGYPGSNGLIPFENGFLSEMLLAHGYNTFAVGKWHLTPTEQCSAGRPLRSLAARPRLRALLRLHGRRHAASTTRTSSTTTTRSSRRSTPEEGYHLTEDLVDHAIEFIADAKQVAPDKPFFMYFCTGRDARAPPRAARVGRQVQGPVRRRLGRLPRRRCSSGSSSWASCPPGTQLSRARSRRRGLGQPRRRREAPLRADDGGLRRLPRAHRPPHRAAARRSSRRSGSSTTR